MKPLQLAFIKTAEVLQGRPTRTGIGTSELAGHKPGFACSLSLSESVAI